MQKSFGAVIVALVVAAVSVLVALWTWKTPTQPGDVAAWAQAITGVMAIVGAFVVVIWQHHLQIDRDRRAAADAKTERVKAAARLLAQCVEAGRAVVAAPTGQNYELPEDEIRHATLVVNGAQAALHGLQIADFEIEPLLIARAVLGNLAVKLSPEWLQGGLPGRKEGLIGPLVSQLEEQVTKLSGTRAGAVAAVKL